MVLGRVTRVTSTTFRVREFTLCVLCPITSRRPFSLSVVWDVPYRTHVRVFPAYIFTRELIDSPYPRRTDRVHPGYVAVAPTGNPVPTGSFAPLCEEPPQVLKFLHYPLAVGPLLLESSIPLVHHA